MIRKIVYNFSKRSSSDLVPGILKHPKFSREGLNKKKSKQYIYDLEQPHIQATKHLFYNHIEKKKEIKQKRKENKLLNSPYEIVNDLSEKRDPNLMLQELFDTDLLHKPSRTIINNIIQLEQQKQISGYEDIVRGALIEVAQNNLKGYSFRDFGIFVSLSERYVQDKETWRIICLNFLKFVENREYQENSILDNNSQKIVSNLVFIFSGCYKNCTKFDMQEELKLLQGISEQYLLDKFQKVADMNQRALCLATLAKNLPENDKHFQDLISIAIFNHIKVEQLNIQSLAALTHMLQKMKMQITHNLYQQIESQLLKLYQQTPEALNQQTYAIFVMSIGNLLKFSKGFSKDFAKFAQTYLLEKEFTNIQDVAFALEGLRKLGLLKKQMFEKFTPLVEQQMEKKGNVNYQIFVQLLRGCYNNLRYDDQVILKLVQQIENQFHFVKESEKQMILQVLNRFSAFVNLEILSQLAKLKFVQKKQE